MPTDGDGELAAVKAIVAALEPLDRAACRRVLRWAEDRYVSEYVNIDPKLVNHFFEAVSSAARQMGDITPLQILKAAALFAEQKENEPDAD